MIRGAVSKGARRCSASKHNHRLTSRNDRASRRRRKGESHGRRVAQGKSRYVERRRPGIHEFNKLIFARVAASVSVRVTRRKSRGRIGQVLIDDQADPLRTEILLIVELKFSFGVD